MSTEQSMNHQSAAARPPQRRPRAPCLSLQPRPSSLLSAAALCLSSASAPAPLPAPGRLADRLRPFTVGRQSERTDQMTTEATQPAPRDAHGGRSVRLRRGAATWDGRGCGWSNYECSCFGRCCGRCAPCADAPRRRRRRDNAHGTVTAPPCELVAVTLLMHDIAH